MQPHDPSAYPTVKLCGAKTRAGTPCQRHAMTNGSGRCPKHGGKSLRGIAHPGWKDGRFSKYLPENLGSIAHKAATDPELFNLRSLIGVYEARLTYLLGFVGTGASPQRFAEIAETWNDFRMAQDMGPAGKARMISAANKMDELVRTEGGVGIGHDAKIWDDVDRAAKNYEILIRSERKRELEMHSLIPAVKAHDLMRDALLIFRRFVHDKHAWGQVQNALAELIGTNHPEIAEAAHRAAEGEQEAEAAVIDVRR